jgi:hypothetical protein
MPQKILTARMSGAIFLILPICANECMLTFVTGTPIHDFKYVTFRLKLLNKITTDLHSMDAVVAAGTVVWCLVIRVSFPVYLYCGH